MSRIDSITEDSKDRIKLYRTLLMEYAGKDCHMYSKTGFKHVYRSESGELWGDHGWEEVRRSVRDLSIEYDIHIELDQYPQTKLITITLTLDE